MVTLAAQGDPGPPYRSSLEHLLDELARLDVLVAGQVARARAEAASETWRGLAISEAEVDTLLARPLGAPPWVASRVEPGLSDAQAFADLRAAAIERRCAHSEAMLRLVQLGQRFELTRFDVDALIVALAPELDLRYERLYAYLHDDVTRKRPSVDLVLHLLCRSIDERIAARARFGGDGPLVRHGLVALTGTADAPLLAHAIKLDDRIVDWLHGSDVLPRRLARVARRIETATAPAARLHELEAPPALRDGLAALAAGPGAPIIYVRGPAGVGKRTTAEAFAHATSRDVLVLDAAALAGVPDEEAEEIVAAAAREARLVAAALLVERADLLLGGERPAACATLIAAAVGAAGPYIFTGEAAWVPGEVLRGRGVACIELTLPDASARERLWRAVLGDTPGVDVVELAARMRLSGGQIHDAAATARGLAQLRAGADAAVTAADLGEACRRHSGHRFGGFARKVAARPGWDDLVLADDRLQRLRELCDHARHRATVFDHWGFDRKLPNGKGLGLLFTGAPGTGKTLAASVIATELGLDLYQIDLASVVSKWIGETEKHLGRIFDEAERGHAVLLFDEADALFGKRSEIQDAHDRYANLETSYLLQRMEAYEGIVILTSNFRRNMDEAFVRRLRFIIEFPLPDERERLRIWERIWPAETPRAPDLDLGYLARRFELAGAYIRNIALAAAFLAAAEGQPVGQRHALHAARREYQKIGKMIDESAFGGRT